jgi:hypothetical protein
MLIAIIAVVLLFVSGVVALVMYERVSWQVWHTPVVWYARWYRPLFFATPSPRLLRITSDIQARCRRAGFAFVPPTIVVVRSWMRRYGQAKLLTHGPRSSQIFLRLRGRKGKLDDRDLEFILAREYAHLIDYVVYRFRHPILRQLIGLDRDSFADVVAAFLYSAEQGATACAANGCQFRSDVVRRFSFKLPGV